MTAAFARCGFHSNVILPPHLVRQSGPQPSRAADFIGTSGTRCSAPWWRTAALAGCGFHWNTHWHKCSVRNPDRSPYGLRISLEHHGGQERPVLPDRSPHKLRISLELDDGGDVCPLDDRSPHGLWISLELVEVHVQGAFGRPQLSRAADFIGNACRRRVSSPSALQPSRAVG